MRYSSLFLKTQRSVPKDEVAANARLLIQANFVSKLMAGVFSFLPLGMRVREKISSIIREEMNGLGAAELLMPALHPRSAWDVTGRWETLREIMYQFKDRAGKEFTLGPTHEEILAPIAQQVINSYHDLPRAVYQIQTKFRNEPRAKSGLLRGREFTMKDLYSFHADTASLNEFYEEAKKAYQRVFQRCGLKSVITEASGGDFSKEYSHEFMVETEAGEDEILLCRLCGWAQNKEIAEAKAGTLCGACKSGALDRVKSVEVGNIFKLGTRFSEPVGLAYKDKGGNSKPVIMGSYGIGVDRLMGTVVEMHHDERGIVWPESVAPACVYLLTLGEREAKKDKFADGVYRLLQKAKVEVLYDDRENVSAGEKFTDADLIGLPWRMVVSEKTLAQAAVEVKRRKEREPRLMKLKEFIQHYK